MSGIGYLIIVGCGISIFRKLWDYEWFMSICILSFFLFPLYISIIPLVVSLLF